MSAAFDPAVAETHLADIVGPAARLCGELASVVDRDRAADATMRVAAAVLLYRRVQRELLCSVNASQRAVLFQWFTWLEDKTDMVLQGPYIAPPSRAEAAVPVPPAEAMAHVAPVALTEDPTLFDIDAWDTPTKESTDG